MLTADVIQDVNVIQGTYEPSEARQVLWGVIDKQINFYKLQYLSQWERNHNTPCDSLDCKIDELNEKRNEVLQMVKEAKAAGRKIKIGGSIEMCIE